MTQSCSLVTGTSQGCRPKHEVCATCRPLSLRRRKVWTRRRRALAVERPSGPQRTFKNLTPRGLDLGHKQVIL